jgi:hypothetical protein
VSGLVPASGTDEQALSGSLAAVGIDLDLETLTRERFEEVGRALAQAVRLGSWAVAAWLAAGEQAFGLTTKEASELLDLAVPTLERIKWVARQVSPERRRPGVSFSAHQLVAALPPEEQTRWLLRAEDDRLSYGELRGLLNAALPAAPEPPAAVAADPRTGGPSAARRAENGSRRGRGRPRSSSRRIPEVEPDVPRVEVEEAAREVVQMATERRRGDRRLFETPAESFEKLRAAVGQRRLL